jgi:UDP-N-acetylmuramoylalanine--D-glutamate ligase
MSTQKKIFVFGLGESGMGTISLGVNLGWEVHVFDDKYLSATVPYPEELQVMIDKGQIKGVRIPPFDDFRKGGVYDLIVVSPGISHIHPLLSILKKHHAPLCNDVELAFRHIPPSQTVIGITGTNGKTTVTEMVTHILNQSGKKAVAMGNHGKSIGYFHQYPADTILVVELSSFQLELISSPALSAAIILNISPNHLDRHVFMEDYILAKLHIKDLLKPDAPFYIEADVQNMAKRWLHGVKSTSYGVPGSSTLSTIEPEYALVNQTILHRTDTVARLPVLSSFAPHDRLNATAAFLLTKQCGITPAQFEAALSSFQKPPHRLQLVRQYQGITYIDDSKSTTVASTIAAVNALEGSILLLAGGVSKGMEYEQWAEALKGKVSKIYCFGRDAKSIINGVGYSIPTELFATLPEAFAKAQEEATSGTTVLLSPGSSSLDQFHSYIARGECFQNCVFTHAPSV